MNTLRPLHHLRAGFLERVRENGTITMEVDKAVFRAGQMGTDDVMAARRFKRTNR